MFSQVSVCSQGISLVPRPFQGVGISGTKPLQEVGMSGGGYVQGDCVCPGDGYVWQVGMCKGVCLRDGTHPQTWDLRGGWVLTLPPKTWEPRGMGTHPLGHGLQSRGDTDSKWAVCMLLECFLVLDGSGKLWSLWACINVILHLFKHSWWNFLVLKVEKRILILVHFSHQRFIWYWRNTVHMAVYIFYQILCENTQPVCTHNLMCRPTALDLHFIYILKYNLIPDYGSFCKC